MHPTYSTKKADDNRQLRFLGRRRRLLRIVEYLHTEHTVCPPPRRSRKQETTSDDSVTRNTKHHHTSTTPVYWRQEAFSLFLGNFTVHTKALYMAETKKRNVCIKVSYWVQQGDNQKTCSTSFDSSNVEAQRMGLPVESTPVKVSHHYIATLPVNCCEFPLFSV